MPSREAFHIGEFNDPKNLEKLSNLENNFEIIDPNNNLDKIAQLKELGFLVFYFSRHASHADIWAAYKVINEVQDKTKPEFRNETQFIYSKSLDTGHQGKPLKVIFEKFKDRLIKKRISPLAVVRDHDIKNYKIEMDFNSLKKLLSVPENNNDFFSFPEGTTEGGQVDDNGRIKGIQPVKDAKAIDKVFKKCAKLNKKFVVFTMTINYPDPVFNKITGFVDPCGKGEVIVGNLLFQQDLLDQKKDPMDIIMEDIAYHTPIEQRGAYNYK